MAASVHAAVRAEQTPGSIEIFQEAVSCALTAVSNSLRERSRMMMPRHQARMSLTDQESQRLRPG